MYIPAVPLTPMNQAYVEKQRATFLDQIRPPDFQAGLQNHNARVSHPEWVGVATEDDIVDPVGRRAMGF
jgi:hypothetical protein